MRPTKLPRTFSADGRSMIFARGNRGEKNESTKEVNLYESKFDGTAWSEPVLLDRISIKDRWDACPALSPDGKILWFASNRKTDSYGNIDIFRAEKDENGEWGSVRNAGKAVNGKGNDLFPYQAPDGRFFFQLRCRAGNGRIGLVFIGLCRG